MAVPTIDVIPNHTAHPGRELSFYVNAFDADGDTLTFSLINDPPGGAFIDNNSGRFTWTPNSQQLSESPFTLTVQVSDTNADTATRDFTITLTNQGPIIDPIASRTAYVYRQLAFYVNARDPEGDPLTFWLESGPQGAYIDPNSGQFIWTPTTRASYPASVTVYDSNGASVTSPAFTINVVSAPPTLDALPAGLTAHPMRELRFYAVGIDPDGDALTYTLTQGPANSWVDPNSGLFSWTPMWNQWTQGQPNTYTIQITVTDSAGLSTTRQCTITVVNQPPTIAPIPQRTAYAGKQLRFNVNAFDPDGDPLTFSLVNPPAGASIDPNSGLFSWTPPPAPLGAVSFTVRAADSGDASADAQFTVNVVDDAPVLETPPTRTGHPGQETSFYANAYDTNGDTLTFRVTAGPNGVSIDPNSGRFSWTPTWNQLGSHSITIEAVDPSNLTDSKQFTIVVSNQAPIIEAVPSRSVTRGNTLAFYVNASDPDYGDGLSFTLAGNIPAGASIDQNSGLFTWNVPANLPPGAYPITVRVSDSNLYTDASFTITVNA